MKCFSARILKNRHSVGWGVLAKDELGHDHNVELAEELELRERARGLTVGLGRSPQVPDRPHDREQNRAAAYHV